MGDFDFTRNHLQILEQKPPFKYSENVKIVKPESKSLFPFPNKLQSPDQFFKKRYLATTNISILHAMPLTCFLWGKRVFILSDNYGFCCVFCPDILLLFSVCAWFCV